MGVRFTFPGARRTRIRSPPRPTPPGLKRPLRYLTLLREAPLATNVHLHAYELMDNHVYLLAPPPQPGDIIR